MPLRLGTTTVCRPAGNVDLAARVRSLPVSQYIHPTAPAKPVHPDSTLVLVFGILSILMCGFLTGIPGIVMGAKGLRQVREAPEALDPGALKPGLVMSIIGTALTALMFVFIVVLVALVAVLHKHGVHIDRRPNYTGVSV